MRGRVPAVAPRRLQLVVLLKPSVGIHVEQLRAGREQQRNLVPSGTPLGEVAVEEAVRFLTGLSAGVDGRLPVAQRSPGGDTIRIRPDITQEDHVEGLPIGTRGAR